MHQNIEIALMKTQSIAFRTWLGRRFTFQQDNEPKHTARLVYWLLCDCPWVAQSQTRIVLNPVKYFCRNLKMCVCPHPTWKRLRGEEVRRQMADNWQMLKRKACRIKQKRLEAVKVLNLLAIASVLVQVNRLRVWILRQCTYLGFYF